MPPRNGHVGEMDEILLVAACYIVVGPPETEVTHIRIRISTSLASRATAPRCRFRKFDFRSRKFIKMLMREREKRISLGSPRPSKGTFPEGTRDKREWDYRAERDRRV